VTHSSRVLHLASSVGTIVSGNIAWIQVRTRNSSTGFTRAARNVHAHLMICQPNATASAHCRAEVKLPLRNTNATASAHCRAEVKLPLRNKVGLACMHASLKYLFRLPASTYWWKNWKRVSEPMSCIECVMRRTCVDRNTLAPIR